MIHMTGHTLTGGSVMHHMTDHTLTGGSVNHHVTGHMLTEGSMMHHITGHMLIEGSVTHHMKAAGNPAEKTALTMRIHRRSMLLHHLLFRPPGNINLDPVFPASALMLSGKNITVLVLVVLAGSIRPGVGSGI